MRTLLCGALGAALLYLCFFAHLNALGLVGPDEPRYAAVARAMAESGDWVTPRLNGKPWFEKPALYYWAAAAAFRFLGPNEASARLPSALAATLAALALVWTAQRFYGPGTAWAVLLIFPTSAGVFAFARAATTDMLFSASLALAMAAAAHSLWDIPGFSLRAGRFAFGAFLGAATLAKGPAAILLAAGSTAVWAGLSRRWKDALGLLHPLAVIPFCLVALPWYALCALRNPEFLATFLLSQNIERYLTPVFHHTQPAWFYGPVLALGLVPWTALLCLAVRDGARGWRAERRQDSPGLFFACWAVFPLLFFSFSQSKLPGYALPALLPLALLLARSIARAHVEQDRLARWAMAGVGGTYAALSLSLGYWLKRLPPEAPVLLAGSAPFWAAVAASAGILLAALGAAGLRPPKGLPSPAQSERFRQEATGSTPTGFGPQAGRLKAALVLGAILAASLVEGINLRVLPQLDTYLSPRTAAFLALQEQQRARPGPAAAGRGAGPVQTYRLRRSWHYGLDFYLGRAVEEWSPGTGSGLVVTSAAGVKDLEQRGVQFQLLQRVSQEAVLVRVEPNTTAASRRLVR